MPIPVGKPREVRTYEKNAPASCTYGVRAVKPTANNSRMMVETTKVAGKPAPLPPAMPSGTTPPMTPGGAAAATTMNTMDGTPRLPRNLRSGAGLGGPARFSAVESVSDMREPPFRDADHRLSGTIGLIRWLKPHLESA